jgi:hypothetical protein
VGGRQRPADHLAATVRHRAHQGAADHAMTRSPRIGPGRQPGAGRLGGRRPRRAGRLAAASGAAVVLAYLVGTAISGQLSPLARRPLLDGLAPPPPYHWVKPPPELSSGNRPPSGASASVPLGAGGSQVSAISTGDGQANLLMEANAIAPAAGQRSVAVAIEPVDPAKLAPAPPNLVLAGNAYRIRFSYRPSGRPVTALAGKATISLVFPLLPIPVTSPFDHTVLSSGDGRAWTRQSSTATPGSHQVASTLRAPGYVIAAVPPAPAEAAAPNRTPLYAGLAAAAVVVAAAAIVLARRLRAAPEGDDDDDYDDEDDPEDAGPGTEERR